MCEIGSAGEQLRAQARCRMFVIEPPEHPSRCWTAWLDGEGAAEGHSRWEWRSVSGGGSGGVLRAADREGRWGDTDAGLVWSVGVVVSARCAAVMGELVGEACGFVPVEVEAADGRGEWYLPRPRETVARVEALRVVRGQRRGYTVVPGSAVSLAVFACDLGGSWGPRCVVSRAVCEGLVERGVEGGCLFVGWWMRGFWRGRFVGGEGKWTVMGVLRAAG